MYDCFITTDYQREYYRNLTYNALILNGVYPQMVEKPMLERYFECERLATTDIYILSDDDIIPKDNDTIPKLIALMEAHPELSQLGLCWKEDINDNELSGWGIGRIDKDVYEMDHVGGVMAIRKGTIKDLGYKTDFEEGIGDDRIMGRTARELGFKVALATNLSFIHLGQGKSTVWKLNVDAKIPDAALQLSEDNHTTSTESGDTVANDASTKT